MSQHELSELKRRVAGLQQNQQQQEARRKIDTAWSQQAGSVPNVLKSAAVAEIGPKAVRELMTQESVDEQVSEFLQRPDVRSLVGQQTAQAAPAETAVPTEPSKSKRPTLDEMLGQVKSGKAKFGMRH